MNAVNSLNGANPYGASMGAIIDGEVFSPETLMIYIASRMNDIDGDIQALLGQQEEIRSKKEALNEVKQWMSDYNAYHESHEKGEYEEFSPYNQELWDAAPYPPEGHPAYDEATQMIDDFKERVLAGEDVTRSGRREVIQNGIADVETALDELDGQSEMAMIRMQQKISDRGTALQMVTQMLQKMGQSLQAIAGNI